MALSYRQDARNLTITYSPVQACIFVEYHVILLQNLCQSWIIIIPTQMWRISRYRCTVVWIIPSWWKAKYRNKVSL